MAVQVLMNQQQGPLPITASFSSPSSAPMYLEVNGSVWTQSANSLIGIEIQVDGQSLGVAHIFSNTSSTHRAVVPAYIPVSLDEGQHKLTLIPTSNSTTVSDQNDYFSAVLHY